MDHSQVIIRPVVSEKSYVLATADKYTFRVHPDAHKTQIKQAIESLFDVTVLEVRTSSTLTSSNSASMACLICVLWASGWTRNVYLSAVART